MTVGILVGSYCAREKMAELRRIFYHTFYAQLFLTDDEQHNKKVEADFEKIDRPPGFYGMLSAASPSPLSRRSALQMA
jgi:hypothetical protein